MGGNPRPYYFSSQQLSPQALLALMRVWKVPLWALWYFLVAVLPCPDEEIRKWPSWLDFDKTSNQNLTVEKKEEDANGSKFHPTCTLSTTWPPTKKERGRDSAQNPDEGGKKVAGTRKLRSSFKKERQKVDYLPSDYSTFQIIHLDEFTEATGVVVVGRLSVTKGLKRRRQKKSKIIE